MSDDPMNPMDAATQVVDEKSNLPRLIALGLAAIALVIFVAQNTQETEVRFLVWEGTPPLFLAILLTVVLTLAITVLTSWFMRRRKRKNR